MEVETGEKVRILNSYETVYILKPEMSEDNVLNLVNKYQNILITNKAKNIFIQNRGRRHLAYPIKKYHDGIYIQMNYLANGEIVRNLEREMRFEDSILRILTIKQNEENI
uniref:30S ribosomal protein S6, chloroplastic n=1 Tax=Porphyridium purpureum TaxID=35688 RepID=W0RYE9_PORPP|nr:chloroplast 30S ribosomal protein S6 [Porphyridium purpureum]ATJ02820.1 30S ribosomal protein S6 [Porphyridium purpureum]BAO23584.1 chloroplast 30S ribosomal protein S6 [Porphyridium purpureum]